MKLIGGQFLVIHAGKFIRPHDKESMAIDIARSGTYGGCGGEMMNVKRARRVTEKLREWKQGKKNILFSMNLWNGEIRDALDYLNQQNPLYPDGSVCRTEITKQAAHCKTACCIGGAIETFFRVKNASAWLDLTAEQRYSLFFPTEYNGVDKDIWDHPNPIHLMGSHEIKYAIKAMRNAIRLWGDKPKKKKAKST